MILCSLTTAIQCYPSIPFLLVTNHLHFYIKLVKVFQQIYHFWRTPSNFCHCMTNITLVCTVIFVNFLIQCFPKILFSFFNTHIMLTLLHVWLMMQMIYERLLHKSLPSSCNSVHARPNPLSKALASAGP